MSQRSLQITGKLWCSWPVAPCRIQSWKGYKLEQGPDWMEYRVVSHKPSSVEMISWEGRNDEQLVNPLENRCDLKSLASCTGQSNSHVIQWVSQWGLLGFRPSRDSARKPGMVIQAGGYEWMGLGHQISFAAEPLERFRETAMVAKAATDLFDALSQKETRSRAGRLKTLLVPDYQQTIGRPDSQQVSESNWGVHGVNVGLHRIPHTQAEWIHLGMEALGELTRDYLDPSLHLRWSERLHGRGNVRLHWELDSLLGALILKMTSQWREAKVCEVCGIRMDHRRAQAKTCSDRCRKRLSLNS